MTRAKARLLMSWREECLYFTPNGARCKRSDPSPFLADIPKDIIRTIDKTTPGHVLRALWGSKNHGSRNGDSRYRGGGGGGATGGGATGGGRGGGGGGGRSDGGAARSQGAGQGRGGRGRGGSSAERRQSSSDALDVTTELFSDIAPDSIRRASGQQQAYGGGRGGGRGKQRGGDGGGDRRSSDSREGRDARVFKEARDKTQSSEHPVQAVRDGGARIARDAGEEIDMSWAKKLSDSPAKDDPGLPIGIAVGVQVRRARLLFLRGSFLVVVWPIGKR